MRTIEQIRADFAEVERLRGNHPAEVFLVHMNLTEVNLLLQEIERLNSRPCPYVVQDRDGTAYCRLGAPPEGVKES